MAPAVHIRDEVATIATQINSLNNNKGDNRPCYDNPINLQIKENKKACENFWKYACAKQAKRGQSDSTEDIVNIYEEELKKAYQANGAYDRVKKVISKANEAWGATAFTEDTQETLLNITNTSGGKKVIAQKMINFLANTPFVELNKVCVDSTFEKYKFIIADKTQNSDFLMKYPIMNPYKDDETRKTLTELFNDFSEFLTDQEYSDFIKDVIVAQYKCYWDQEEERVDMDDDFQKKVHNRVFPEKLKNNLRSIYSRMLKYSNASILGLGTLNESDRASLAGVKFVFPIENTWSIPSFRELATTRNASHKQTENTIMAYGGYARASDHEIINTLAHEYGHAVSHSIKGEPHKSMYDNVKKCLRTKSSVNASSNEEEEAFADWFATEITASYIKDANLTVEEQRNIAINAGPITCRPLSLYTGKGVFGTPDPHPRWDIRTNRVFMANPYIRSLFGCKQANAPQHCSAGWSSE